MSLWERKKIVVIVMSVVLGVSLHWGIDAWLSKEQLPVVEKFVNQEELKAKTKLVTIYISGAVKKPGIYQVPVGIRVQEVIRRTGGFCTEAATHKVNLVKKCKDGMHINVPGLSRSKRKQQKPKALSTKRTVSGKVKSENNGLRKQSARQKGKIAKHRKLRKINLNTANSEELMSLPGIGAVTAEAIIQYRKWHRFYAVWEVKKVPGVTNGKYKILAPWLEV